MYCKKCDKTLPADSTFCPYCGNEKLEADVGNDIPTEPVEAAETVEETVEAAEAVAEEPVEAEETAETPVEEDGAAEVAPVIEGDKIVEGKSGKTAVLTVLGVLVVLAAIACAFLIGLSMDRGDAAVTTDGVVTTQAPVEDADLFPTEYTTVYADGYAYADADLSQYVTLGKYKDVTVTLTTSSEITDADVEAYIQNVLAQYTTTEAVDRAAALGDTVVIDYVGRTLDGVAFEGGTASNQTLTPLGSAGYIDGFESGIVGMKAGETKVIDVTFPTEYHNADLAGQPAQFEITLSAVKATVKPEYNDAFVREHFDYATMPEYEAYVRTVLAQNREAEILAEKQDGVLSIAVDNATVSGYPENLVEDYMFQQIDYVRQYAAMYGMTYSEFTEQAIGMTAAAYEAEVRASAQAAIKQEMVMYAIAKAEGITVSDEDRAEAEGYYLSYYGAEDISALCEQLGITEQYFKNTIDFSVTYANVTAFLTENATFTGAK